MPSTPPDASARRAQLQAQLGDAVRRLRLERDIEQATLSEIAGVSRQTVINLEQGRGATTATLVSVVDALGAAEWIEALCPPPPALSPMALLRMQQEQERNQPKRASRKR